MTEWSSVHARLIKKVCARAFFLFLLIGVRGIPSLAQGTTAEIVGTVKDPSGAVLPGVTLTVTHRASGQQRSLTTDNSGEYAVSRLPVGEYAVKAELPNFKTQVREGIVLQVAERVRVDLTLEVGDIAQQITVTELVPLLRTTNAEVGEVISNQRLINLPLNGRQFVDLTLLSDNVVIEPRGTRGAALGQTGRTVAVAGQRGGHNMYFLDGVSVTDQYFNNLSVAPSVDAIQEFNVQKSIYSAEFGGKASATVSAATKSGTNVFHGAFYEFLRNDVFDARNFFDSSDTPPLRQNQFGGAWGGPIRKDSTFFFINYEGLRERRALTRTFSLPSAAVRNGDFAGLPTIYNPLLTDPVTGRRQPFPGNRIPGNQLDPVAVAFLEKAPLPNLPGEVQNFAASPTQKNDQNQFHVRADRRLGDHDTLFARFTFADMETFRPFGSTDLNETLVPGFGTKISTSTRNLALNETHVFSPSLIHEFRFGFLRVTGGQESENSGVDFAGRSNLRGVTRDLRKAGFPAMSFADLYSTMGDPANLVSRRNNSFDYFSNLSWIRGPHNMKFGAYLFRLRFNPQDSPNARGSFAFTPRFTSSAAGLADGNAFADFLLGYPSTARGGIGRGEQDSRSTWLHLYAQDDWRASQHLTLNVGLRYEMNGHMKEVGNRLSNMEVDRFVIASDAAGRIHPDANALLPLIPVPFVTSEEAGYGRSLFRPSYQRIAPRIGLAWSPGRSEKTVFRSGFGLFFNQWAYSVQTVLMQNLPFYFNKSVTTAADTPVPTLSTGNILEAAATGTIGGAGIDHNYRTEYAASWSVGLQRMLTSNWLAEASYFGSKIVGADDNTYENIPAPGPGPVDPRRPNPNLSGFRNLHWGGWSTYHSLSLKLEKRYSYGLTFNTNYTWSKAIDVASSPGATFSEFNFPQDVRNRRAEKALSSFDHRHRLVLSYSYELPFGKGRSWNPNSWVGRLAEGWTVTGIGAFQSGAPFTVNIPSDNANVGAGPAQRPDLAGSPNLDSGQTAQRWFATEAFRMPAPFTFGNAGRNIVFADGLTNLDLSLLKNTPVTEQTRLEFRAEIFNLLNNTNFADAPGRIAFTPNFGRYFTAENPRQIQLGLKLIF